MKNLESDRLLPVKAGVANLTMREIDPAPCKNLTIFIGFSCDDSPSVTVSLI
jgi:hypothetical protein